MKAVCLVAHPDDCAIYGWPFMEAHRSFDWTVVYLTYKESDPRAREIRAYWTKRGISTEFMGHVDNYLDLTTNRFNFWNPQEVKQTTVEAIQLIDPELILTHNENGEYGHIHHRFVNQIANSIDKPKVYFADNLNYNVEYTVLDSIEVDELPLHREVIVGFMNRNTGRYTVTTEANILITKYNENTNT